MPEMTKAEAAAAVAQGVINIAEGITTIEKGSRVYRGMEALCRYAHEDLQEWTTLADLVEGK